MEPLTKRIDSYDVAMVPMGTAHLARLCELSVSVRWPQRMVDWQMVLALGQGVVLIDEIDRLLGSAMVFPMGESLVHVGMVITSPRFQERGAGRWMMEDILARSAGRVSMLNATKEAYRLYLSLGFEVVGRVWQQQGIANALPGRDLRVRPGEPADRYAILALDRRAFGSDRGAVLEYVLERSAVQVLEEAGEVRGFALCRPSGRGHVIGPVVAQTEVDAVSLIRPHIAAHSGGFMRMDTRHASGALQTALEAAGLVHYDNALTMSLGAEPERDPSVQTFGLVSHAFG